MLTSSQSTSWRCRPTVPPALSQLALSVAFVTSPAEAGPVTASAKANASIEANVFMVIFPLSGYEF